MTVIFFNCFLALQEGSFEVLLTAKSSTGVVATERVFVAPAGGSFGELALLYFAARAATVKASRIAVCDNTRQLSIFLRFVCTFNRI